MTLFMSPLECYFGVYSQRNNSLPTQAHTLLYVCYVLPLPHYGDVITGAKVSQFTSLTIVYSTVYSDADQGKHQSSASLAFVRGIHRGPPHKWPVMRKMFPFDGDIYIYICFVSPVLGDMKLQMQPDNHDILLLTCVARMTICHGCSRVTCCIRRNGY